MRAFRDVTLRTRACAGRFIRSTNGNVAMIFGLVVILLVMICGAGIDVARAVSMRARLGAALDAAALAVGAELNKTQAELDQLAQDYFDANYPPTALGTHNPVVVTPTGDSSYSLSVSGKVDTIFLKLVDITEFDVSVDNSVTRSANDIEVALALDVTNSMTGQPIADLKVAAKDMIDMVVQDVQAPFYTKLAIVPYSMAVNTGSYANSVRGNITGPTAITNAAWQTGANKNITLVTKANPAVVTSAGHGLVPGNKVWISGVGGMKQLNDKPYIVGAVPNANTFQLKDFNNNNLNSSGYSLYTLGGLIRQCVIPTVGVNGCEIQVTSAAHGLANNDYVVIKSVVGMTQINTGTNVAWQVSGATVSTFNLPAAAMMPSGANPAWSYTSGGSAYCTVQGCEWLRFTNENNGIKVFPISTCASERTGANAFTDAGPNTTLFGRVYPAAPPAGSSSAPCTLPAFMPLQDNKTTLKAKVDALVAGGATGGHIGIAWGWYMLSPNFGYLFPGVSQPAPYGQANLFKVLILMTDGEYNSSYCTGVISQDSTAGSGSTDDHINCDAPNGHAYVQSDALCDAIKANGIIVYTVGFNVNSSPNAQNLVADCASSASHAYYPNTGAELKQTFQLIAQEISQLRLSQ